MTRSMILLPLAFVLFGTACATAPRPSLARLEAAAAVQCEGLPASLATPGALVAQASSTQPLLADVQVTPKVTHRRTVGVSLYVPAQHGTTPELLRRSASCHVAQSDLRAARGEAHDALLPPGADVTVHGTKTGYVVEVRASDRSHVDAMLARVQGRSGT